MLANAELAQDFFILNQQYKRLVSGLLDILDISPERITLDATDDAALSGMDADKMYFVESGSLSARYRARIVYLLDEGDLILPDVAGTHDPEVSVTYGSENGANLLGYSALEFMRRIFNDPAATKLWTRLLITHAGMQVRLAAALTEEDSFATPGYEIYNPGDVMIRQGDKADYVFNLAEGTAEVVVDGVTVGGIEEGEIFGAMAVLTNADRTATVVAKSRCSVVKVPKDQFAELIKSNPATIHDLLVDMANSIVNLNEQLVGLRGSYMN
ncbi:cyclic nucleotide-binding domain-containing protein [Halieaceae bacterium IMCC14734]|uniref:Cyclic nucleotide-binding domain-containing protein n=1 Tax=Candidatus Litorirhabdus singularis TaxID=2518993 RepID=A0ABT3TBZ7_9GAMM|nr:cyclic nucleotide-binding domain-containing protein [Candidatus Litorirhabdus singularis]MCX2979821.1 cyclic nucleotide-binding domain-containing protein [Candidatus Litorirhabdus singularis]